MWLHGSDALFHVARIEARDTLNDRSDRLPNLRRNEDRAERLDVHSGGDRHFRSSNRRTVVREVPSLCTR
jgi:hypothetical protein